MKQRLALAVLMAPKILTSLTVHLALKPTKARKPTRALNVTKAPKTTKDLLGRKVPIRQTRKIHPDQTVTLTTTVTGMALLHGLMTTTTTPKLAMITMPLSHISTLMVTAAYRLQGARSRLATQTAIWSLIQ